MKRQVWHGTLLVVGLLLVWPSAARVWADTPETDWPAWDEDAGQPQEGEPAASPKAPPDPLETGASVEEEGARPEEERVQPPAAGEVRLVSVDFKDADIRQVLRVISLKSGVDIVAGADVEGLVSIKLTNVPWEQALEVVLRTYGFTYERRGNIVRVITLAALEQEAL
ncbi:MAG: secretin and TonB N-terminal domain-containing protein, partial [Candidatus Omnitrophica bacterium]|nr:secretin and TonB N-terminal domain-containing protein [Candidatus Omnitrophota bacterium]